MANCEDVGFEPSGRNTKVEGHSTDLDVVIDDFRNGNGDDLDDLDIFAFAERLYGTKAHRRRDQIIRGTNSGAKASFYVRASALSERMDPSFYLFSKKLEELSADMEPIGLRVKPRSERFRPNDEKSLDQDYSILSVSSDGLITVREVLKGEDIATPQKCVKKGDIVYNPMRANIGSIGVVINEINNPLASPDYHVLQSEGIDAEFLISILRTPFYKFYIDVVTTGSIRDRLYPKNLQDMRIPKTSEQSRKKLKALQSQILQEAERHADCVSGLYANLNQAVRSLIRVHN